MKLNLSSFCIAFLSAFTLASCHLIGSSSGGTQVKNPTVDQMTEMEKQWGVQPHTGRSRQSIPSGGSNVSVPTPHSAAPQTIIPEPVPLPQTQTAVPPVFESPPAATPAQIQKLKN